MAQVEEKKLLNKKIIKSNQFIKNVYISGNPEIIYKSIPATFDEPENEIVEEPQENILQFTEEKFNEKLNHVYQQGFDEGLSLQKDKIVAELKQRVDLLDKIAKEVASFKSEIFKSSDEIVVNLALEIARKIINYQVTDDTSTILEVVKKALKKLTAMENKFVVHINPEDEEVLSLHIEELANQTTSSRHIEIQADNRITKGGCLVESDFSTIDATIETQMQEIERALHKELEDAR